MNFEILWVCDLEHEVLNLGNKELHFI
jgi:hypothetical protein